MRISAVIVGFCALLAMSTNVAADVLQFVCVGKESIYTETFEAYQQNLTHKPATVQIELDRGRKTMSVSGTTTAEGKGALKDNPTAFEALFERKRVIYEVPFKYVQVSLPQSSNDITIIAMTHEDLYEPDAEGRLLFSGTCRLPKQKNE